MVTHCQLSFERSMNILQVFCGKLINRGQNTKQENMSSKDSENLATDAFPSPPRDNSNNEEIETRDENIGDRRRSSTNSNKNQWDSGSDSDHTSSTNYSSTRRRDKNKSRRGFPGPNSFASAPSIININNSSGVHIGSSHTYIVKTSNDIHKKNRKHIPKTDGIIALLNSEKIVTEKDIQFISAHVDEQWAETARVLNYSDGQISQFHCDYIKTSLKEVIYQFFLDWIRNEGDSATSGKLATALWNTGQKDCVLRWSEI